MILVPLISALVGVAQRWWSSRVGEGIIFDLRRQLFAHLQRMSLRFFTATKTGELMNRLNSDVEGSQSAITGTLMTIISNLVSVAFILVVMLLNDWQLTVLAVAVLPLFVIPARRVAKVLRRMTQQLMEQEAKMSGTLQESFNVSGALLVRLFGRWDEMAQRFGEQAAQVRDLEVRRAMVGRGFFAALGLVAAVGTATVFWVGGYQVIQGDHDGRGPGDVLGPPGPALRASGRDLQLPGRVRHLPGVFRAGVRGSRPRDRHPRPGRVPSRCVPATGRVELARRLLHATRAMGPRVWRRSSGSGTAIPVHQPPRDSRLDQGVGDQGCIVRRRAGHTDRPGRALGGGQDHHFLSGSQAL